MQNDKTLEVRAWFAKAAQDLRSAEVDLAASPPIIEDALFHCQQAAEKAMKGFLTAHDRPFQKTHDLDEVGRSCEAVDPDLRAILGRARDLTVFAWVFRYPGESSTPTREEADDALALARRVYDAILARLPDGLRP